MIDTRGGALCILGLLAVHLGEVLADEDHDLLLVVADRLLPASTPFRPRLGGCGLSLAEFSFDLLAFRADVLARERAPL